MPFIIERTQKDQQGKLRVTNSHTEDEILLMFKEKGVIRTSVPVNLVNSEGKTIGMIEPNWDE